jgi:hypothetical protein
MVTDQGERQAVIGRALGDQALVAQQPLREELVKIGARIMCDGRYVMFQLDEVAVPRARLAPTHVAAPSALPGVLERGKVSSEAGMWEMSVCWHGAVRADLNQ